jgi:hypothetical protein
MSVMLDGNGIRLVGPSAVEDAEPLLAGLLEDRTRSVDLRETGHLHTAVIQVLLAVRPELIGPSPDAFNQKWLMPLLDSRTESKQDTYPFCPSNPDHVTARTGEPS